MGSLSTMHRKGRFSRYRKPERRPLRKIVGYAHEEIGGSGVFVLYEVLECGHQQRPREDFIGEVPAARRRCKKCPCRQE